MEPYQAQLSSKQKTKERIKGKLIEFIWTERMKLIYGVTLVMQ
jgi:hypothetical protein